MDFISGQLFSLTNSNHRIQGQFVNKPLVIFCIRYPFKGKKNTIQVNVLVNSQR